MRGFFREHACNSRLCFIGHHPLDHTVNFSRIEAFPAILTFISRKPLAVLEPPELTCSGDQCKLVLCDRSLPYTAPSGILHHSKTDCTWIWTDFRSVGILWIVFHHTIFWRSGSKTQKRKSLKSAKQIHQKRRSWMKKIISYFLSFWHTF